MAHPNGLDILTLRSEPTALKERLGSAYGRDPEQPHLPEAFPSEQEF